MTITNSTIDDIPEIFRLYKLATEYQKEMFPLNQWPEFHHDLISLEVKEERQFKILVDNEITCIWALTFSDDQIWEGSENDSAIYIHRIATNPEYRGHNYVQEIVEWAKDYSSQNEIEFIRMDTCGNNLRLISHYSNCGFDYLGMKKLKDSTGLQAHYQDADVCFFEIKTSSTNQQVDIQ